MALQGISSLSALINRLSGGNSGSPDNAFAWKVDLNTGATIDGATIVADNTIVGRWTSLWRYDGWPSAGAVPTTTITKPDGTTTGAIRQRIPSASEAMYATGACAHMTQTGTLLVYDRLWSVGGLDANVATTNTFSTDNPTRRNSSVYGPRGKNSAYGNVMFVEIYTQIGVTARELTVTYLYDGTNSATSPAVVLGATNARERGRIIPIPVNPTYPSVVQPKTAVLNLGTGTAGNYGITLARPLIAIPCAVINVPVLIDFISTDPGLVYCGGSPCLNFMWLANSTTNPIPMMFNIQTVLGADT